MSLATLQGHLKALAQAGSQHALFRSQQGMLQTRTEAIRVWDCSNDAFLQIAREPAFVDEGPAGIVLASHHKLQRHNTTMKADLKVARRILETARQNTELESQLRVADMELESKQRQYEREKEFAQGQKAEVDRLKDELKEVRSELKTKKAELETLRAQTPPVQTMAQYQTMPPGQHYGSPMQTGTMPQGHYSLTVVPYAGAANLTASPGQVSTVAGFSYHGTPVLGPQVHGSPQPQGPQVLLRPPTFVPQGTQQAPPQQVQSPPEDPIVSSAGPIG